MFSTPEFRSSLIELKRDVVKRVVWERENRDADKSFDNYWEESMQIDSDNDETYIQPIVAMTASGHDEDTDEEIDFLLDDLKISKDDDEDSDDEDVISTKDSLDPEIVISKTFIDRLIELIEQFLNFLLLNIPDIIDRDNIRACIQNKIKGTLSDFLLFTTNKLMTEPVTGEHVRKYILSMRKNARRGKGAEEFIASMINSFLNDIQLDIFRKTLSEEPPRIVRLHHLQDYLDSDLEWRIIIKNS